MTRRRIPNISEHVSVPVLKPVFKIYLDTIGPFTPTGFSNESLGLINTDAFTRFRWFFAVLSKADIPTQIIFLCRQIFLQRGNYPAFFFQDKAQNSTTQILSISASSLVLFRSFLLFIRRNLTAPQIEVTEQ